MLLSDINLAPWGGLRQLTTFVSPVLAVAQALTGGVPGRKFAGLVAGLD